MTTRPPKRVRKRDATALAGASAASGLLAYLVFAITTRTLGAHQAAAVSVLWTLWSFATAGLTFPIQHWLTQVAASGGGLASAGRALPRMAGAVIGASAALAGVAYLLREDLFHRGGVSFPAMTFVLVTTCALVGVSRGVLTAEHRYGAVAMSIGLENGIRALLVGALATLGTTSAPVYGAAIVAGNAVALIWPHALTPRHGGEMRRGTLRHLAGSSASQLLSQLVLTGGPVLLALAGGRPNHVTALFAAMALLRAPHVLALGLVSTLTGRVARLVADGRVESLVRFRRTLVAGSAAAAFAAAAGGALVLPWLVQVVFGGDVRIEALPSAVLASATVLAVANLLISVVVIAHASTEISSCAWAAGLAAAAPVLALGPANLLVICLTFLVAEFVAFLGLLTIDLLAMRQLERGLRQTGWGAG